jgi:hypothetical protein
MFEDDKKDACCHEANPDGRTDNCDCGCDSCGDNEDFGESVITMTDTETGEEYNFTVADDFIFEEEHYCVLVTMDDESDPEMVITKVVAMEDGSEGLMSLDDAEYDRIYAEYERICEEETDEDEDSDEES